ncbi:MAG TPA: hypothetical protein ENI68_07520 [Gammaproteobacteria bacterium]|nr:hypothetical protein [Gammaproteobacteria bacterium]
MVNRLEVYEYSIESLRKLIADKSGSSEDVIGKKPHHHYFKGYCDFIGVKTIVVENDYIDHDFLEDFSAYYVRCFSQYRRFCTRLHFFNIKFTQDDFEKHLKSSADAAISRGGLQEGYLGFVVVKPLPLTVIGRTCLKTYPTENRRCFPIVRSYTANLFGAELTVDSLAFQEQDHVVAACATSALWSVFQGTSIRFQHTIPSPVEITRAATERSSIETRILPSRGLSAAMMAHAIRNVGLEPYLVNVSNKYNEHILKSTVYAYLRGGIPMILGIELWDISGDKHKSIGFHAVAVTGFSLGGNAPIPIGDTRFSLTASKVDKLYVHDDQVGPFARMEFDGIKIVLGKDALDKQVSLNSLSTSWIGGNNTRSVRACPTILLIPLYNKIRIPYGVIHDTIVSFDSFFESLRESLPSPFDGRIEWDIYLTTNNKLKTELLETEIVRGDYRRNILLEGMPRFLWRATARHRDTPLMDLLFDATDIEQGPFFVRAIEYDSSLSLFLRVVSKVDAIEQRCRAGTAWKIIQWFKQQPIPELGGQENNG